jgi:RES domain-containing protein
VILWRLAPHRHARNLDGAGNRDAGARWNSGRGQGVVYASLNVATCVLETFVHFGPTLRAKLPANLVLVELEVPDDAGLLRIVADAIPADADVSGEDSGPVMLGWSAPRPWS